MKNVKLKVIASLMAAVTTVCASQSLSASAYQRTSTYQYLCETSDMPLALYAWRYNSNGYRGGKFRENASWNQTVTSGLVFGPGYTWTTISGKYEGQQLTGSQALARAMAESYFDTKIFMEHYCDGRFYQETLGDQLTLTNSNGVSRTLFVIGNGKFVELQNGKIKYNVTAGWANGGYYFNNNYNDMWYCSYVTRPIKVGDANGDGVVANDDYYNTFNDVSALSECAVGNYPSGACQQAIIAACDFNGDGRLSMPDAYYLAADMNIECTPNHTGRTYSYGYVKSVWN